MNIIPNFKIDFEREFNNEIRHKKKIGANAYKMRGKGKKNGIKGGMKTTYDFLTTKERKKLNGEVKTMNVYTSLIPYTELKTYTPEKQKQIIEQWLKNHQTKEVIEALEISHNSYYNLLYKLGIKEAPPHKKQTKDYPVAPIVAIGEKGNAEKGDVIAYKDFLELPLDEQYLVLDYYTSIYTARSVGKIWNKKLSSMHQFKYQMKKDLKNQGIWQEVEQKKNNREVVESILNKLSDKLPEKEPEQTEKSVAIEPEPTMIKTEEEQPKVSDKLNEKIKEQEKEAIISQKEPELDEKEQTEGYNTQMDEKEHETAKIAIQKYMNDSWESEKEKLHLENFAQQKAIDYLKSELDKYMESTTNLVKEVQELKKEKETQSTMTFNAEPGHGKITTGKVAELTPMKKPSFTMQYDEEQEGFLMHPEIESFVSFLKKNPNKFKVNMTIQKIDE